MSREIENIEKKKKSLLLAMMQCKFEENVLNVLENENYSSMDELDEILDVMMRKYYSECDLVVNYYDSRINNE